MPDVPALETVEEAIEPIDKDPDTIQVEEAIADIESVPNKHARTKELSIDEDTTLVSYAGEYTSGTEGDTGATVSDGGAGEEGLAIMREVRIGEIRSAIQAAVVYPPVARKRGLEGTVLASFFVGVDGVPHEVRVVQSSGYRMFDREVVRVIRAASPYPPVDAAVEVPVTFHLRDIASQ